jgi:hypothetical protein
MSLAARWLARGAAAKAAKVANDQAPEPSRRRELSQLSHVSQMARIGSGGVRALDPTEPCPASGC